MRVLIHAADAQQWCDLLKARLPEGAVVTSSTVESTMPADYLVVWRPSAALLARQRQAQAVICLGAGVDALLANPGLAPGMPVVKLRDAGMAPLMVDYVRYGIFHFRLNFDQYLANETTALWKKMSRPAPADWPIGILGLGAIGCHVAQALVAEGYPVHGWSRTAKTVNGVQCHHGADGLQHLLGKVTTLIALLPETDATRHILDAGTLACLPQGASLINPGRGGLIDESALMGAIDTGHLRGAMLDALAAEPLPVDSPLWHHPKIRITPHIAAPTPQVDAAEQVADTILAMERGEAVERVDRAAGY